MKLENGRLIEKYKYEQKQVAKLKEEVKETFGVLIDVHDGTAQEYIS